ncbi:DUF885 domain-containing protein [Anaerostipes sp.]|uniref:DUF885 domain-containing protein n=1 Tax=Anaerostipes sp. TaxID=1872530 RepID=UPI0025BCDA7C|nr:DUF885 domain-containing protein [Anaerostipes sp.]MBS7008395.1 DUF885 domain-containing protein [Anaerostipes sp.]
MIKRKKQLVSLLLSLLLAVSLAGCSTPSREGTADQGSSKAAAEQQAKTGRQKEFDKFLSRQVKESLSENTLNLHYQLKDPEKYGIRQKKVSIGHIVPGTDEKALEENKKTAKELAGFDRSSLTKEQKRTYDILKDYLDMLIEEQKYPLYSNIIGDVSGIQSNLPVTFAEYQFYRKKDADDYLELLSQLKGYLAEAGDYLKAQSEAGLYVTDKTADNAAKQIDDFLKESGSKNILSATFKERINSLSGLSNKQKSDYIKRNKKLLSGSVYPGFREFKKTILSLKGTGKNSGGVCRLKNGKDYYQLVLRQQTGTDKTINELGLKVTQRLQSCMRQMMQLMESDKSLQKKFYSFDPVMTNPKKILEDLEKQAKKDYPPLKKVNYKIKYVPEALEDTLSPAFYMIPPMDDESENTIYINKGSTDKNGLYTTLAHEGYPGHLYENNYFLGTDPDDIRLIMDFPGYSEGWASYVEMHAYDYVPYDKSVGKLLRVNTEMNMCLGSVMDIKVNYSGWSLSKAKEFLKNIGYSTSDAERLYRLVTAEPGYYLKYYAGALEFQELRSRASKELGKKFEAKEFHRAVLENGPSNFAAVRKAVEAYIKENK